MITAHNFSQALKDSGWGFGTSKESSVAALRELAARIEAGDVLMQSARVTSFADKDNYTFTGVRLLVAEKKVVELRGSESPFPVEVTK